MTMEDFKKEAALTEETAVIGTNITLHQEIHGEGSVTYRYKLKTDCPHWTYEDRYVSTAPLTWVKDGAAVETEATSLKIEKNGETYAVGQYFYVPLLNLSMDDLTMEQYKEQLWAAAYQTYTESGWFSAADPKLITIFIVGIVGILIMLAFLSDPFSSKPKTVDENQEQIIAVEDCDDKTLVLYHIKTIDKEQFEIMVKLVQDAYKEYDTAANSSKNDDPKWLISLLEHKWYMYHINYFHIGCLHKEYGTDLLKNKKVLLLDREHMDEEEMC